MEVELWRPDRRKNGYDIDNFLKCLLDAFTYANIWVDDEQVDCLLVHKRGVEAPGKIKVTIREI
jgi:crossover junction endodeoxyribonuclease RusA